MMEDMFRRIEEEFAPPAPPPSPPPPPMEAPVWTPPMLPQNDWGPMPAEVNVGVDIGGEQGYIPPPMQAPKWNPQPLLEEDFGPMPAELNQGADIGGEYGQYELEEDDRLTVPAWLGRSAVWPQGASTITNQLGDIFLPLRNDAEGFLPSLRHLPEEELQEKAKQILKSELRLTPLGEEMLERTKFKLDPDLIKLGVMGDAVKMGGRYGTHDGGEQLREPRSIHIGENGGEFLSVLLHELTHTAAPDEDEFDEFVLAVVRHWNEILPALDAIRYKYPNDTVIPMSDPNHMYTGVAEVFDWDKRKMPKEIAKFYPWLDESDDRPTIEAKAPVGQALEQYLNYGMNPRTVRGSR